MTFFKSSIKLGNSGITLSKSHKKNSTFYLHSIENQKNEFNTEVE